MKNHICTESPCPIEDRELTERFINSSGTIYAKTPLEQFNEEVMREFNESFPKLDYPLHITGCRCSEELDEDISKNIIQDKMAVTDFITQKLTEHKALILKMVRERAPKIKITGEGTYCQTCRQHKAAGECDCIGFNKGVQEFLNNLDTI